MSLAQALEWKYGPVASVNLDTMEITSWSHPTIPQPNASQVAKDESEYNDKISRDIYKDEVNIEAQRRIISHIGCDSLEACLIKEINMQMRSAELLKSRVLNGAWSLDEQEEVNVLQDAADYVKEVRAASNLIALDIDVMTIDDMKKDLRWP